MGRYYSGDIEGKMWFAVQDSNDWDYFGKEGNYPERLENYYEKEDLPEIKKGIENCKKMLGKYKKELDLIFKREQGYNDKELAKCLKIKEDEVKPLLEWYARLEKGKQLYNFLIQKGQDYCQFEVELG